MNEPKLIAAIRKNSQEEVRVTLSTFNGHDLIDIRTFTEFENAPGERRATKKGISLKIEKLPELIEALKLAERGGA